MALLAASIGLLLFVRDLVSAFQARLDSPPDSTPMNSEMAEETMAIAAPLAEAMGTLLPRCILIDDEEPRLFLSGVRSPCLTVSRGAVALLPPGELRIAIAHELAHRERNDLALGWFLMFVRAVLFFNPLAQVVGRKILHDVERRADERAIQITGDRFLAASALARFADPASGAQDVSRRAPDVCPSPPDIGARWQNLVDPDFGRSVTLPGARLALTALAVGTICVFVV
jgi:Zn-dependent protease with chaperone function